MRRRLAEMTWKEAEEAIASSDCVVLPLGSCEQHGFHMTLDTDIVTATHMADDLAERVNGVVLPVVPYGQVWSAKDYPGTISLSPATLKSVVKDVCKSMLRHGARKIVLLSGHMGNLPYLKEAARELYDEGIRERILFFCYPEYKKMSKDLMETEMWNGSGFHAGELETSLMLYLAPEKVDMEKAVAEYPDIDPTADYRIVAWRSFNPTGVFGDARASTAEKGKVYYERMIAFISRIVDPDEDTKRPTQLVPRRSSAYGPDSPCGAD